MEKEHLEAQVAELHEALVADLLSQFRNKEKDVSASDKRLALDLCKYNHVRDLRPPAESPVHELEEELNLPFAIDKELD